MCGEPWSSTLQKRRKKRKYYSLLLSTEKYMYISWQKNVDLNLVALKYHNLYDINSHFPFSLQLFFSSCLQTEDEFNKFWNLNVLDLRETINLQRKLCCNTSRSPIRLHLWLILDDSLAAGICSFSQSFNEST